MRLLLQQCKADNSSQVFNGLLGLWELGSSGHTISTSHPDDGGNIFLEILEETNYTYPIHCKNPEKQHL
jgi:hypothetical protein